MSDQLALEGTGAPTPPDLRLTPLERIALELIHEAARDGGPPITSRELGEGVQRARGKQIFGEWEEAQGARLGAQLRRHRLVRYSRTVGGWVPIDYTPPVPPGRGPGTQIPY